MWVLAAIPADAQAKRVLSRKNWLPGTPSEVQIDHLEGDDQKTREKSTNSAIANYYESNVYNPPGIAGG